MMLEIHTFYLNFLEECCYVIYNPDTREAVLVDCGAMREAEGLKIAEFIENNGLKPVRHLVTHAHFDHIWGARFVYDKWHLMPEILPQEVENYTNAVDFMKDILKRDFTLSLPPYKTINEGQHTILGTEMEVLHTPGHTIGSACYYFPSEKLLFSGDTLFAEGITGRTDFPTGSQTDMESSVERLKKLPQDTKLLPGHRV